MYMYLRKVALNYREINTEESSLSYWDTTKNELELNPNPNTGAMIFRHISFWIYPMDLSTIGCITFNSNIFVHMIMSSFTVKNFKEKLRCFRGKDSSSDSTDNNTWPRIKLYTFGITLWLWYLHQCDFGVLAQGHLRLLCLYTRSINSNQKHVK